MPTESRNICWPLIWRHLSHYGTRTGRMLVISWRGMDHGSRLFFFLQHFRHLRHSRQSSTSVEISNPPSFGTTLMDLSDLEGMVWNWFDLIWYDWFTKYVRYYCTTSTEVLIHYQVTMTGVNSQLFFLQDTVPTKVPTEGWTLVHLSERDSTPADGSTGQTLAKHVLVRA